MDSLELCRKYKEREYNDRVSHIVKLSYLRGIKDETIILSFTDELRDLLQKVEVGLRNIQSSSYKDTILLDSHSSATIEGCRTTIERVRTCIKGEKPTKDDLMVLNILKAQNMYKSTTVSCVKDIVDMWMVISKGVCENTSKQGKFFRSSMVYIGNENRVVHTPEVPDKIPKKLELLVDFLNSNINQILKGIICHYYIEYIHPMCDGNGRLGRLLQSIVISGNIFKIPVISTINENLSGYYKSIKDSNVPCNVCGLGMCIDVAPFVEYMLLCMLMATGY